MHVILAIPKAFGSRESILKKDSLLGESLWRPDKPE